MSQIFNVQMDPKHEDGMGAVSKISSSVGEKHLCRPWVESQEFLVLTFHFSDEEMEAGGLGRG